MLKTLVRHLGLLKIYACMLLHKWCHAFSSRKLLSGCKARFPLSECARAMRSENWNPEMRLVNEIMKAVVEPNTLLKFCVRFASREQIQANIYIKKINSYNYMYAKSIGSLIT